MVKEKNIYNITIVLVIKGIQFCTILFAPLPYKKSNFPSKKKRLTKVEAKTHKRTIMQVFELRKCIKVRTKNVQ